MMHVTGTAGEPACSPRSAEDLGCDVTVTEMNPARLAPAEGMGATVGRVVASASPTPGSIRTPSERGDAVQPSTEGVPLV